MKCHSLRDAIVELARGREAGPGTIAAIESHVEHCAACAALMARERQLSRGIAGAGRGDRGRRAIGRLGAACWKSLPSASRPAAGGGAAGDWLDACGGRGRC